jgi:hypothetical protein
MSKLTFDQRIHAVFDVGGGREVPVRIRLVRTTDPTYAKLPGKEPTGKSTSWMIIPKRRCDQGAVFTRAIEKKLKPYFSGGRVRYLNKPRVRVSITPDSGDRGFLIWQLESELRKNWAAGGGVGWDGKSLATLDVYSAWVIADFLCNLFECGFDRFTNGDGKPIPFEDYVLLKPVRVGAKQGVLFESV